MLAVRPRAAFTLVEVVTALFIVMVGIIGAYGLVNQAIVSANSASMRMTAAYLGKEGIEIVKNIRDTNYLESIQAATGAYTWRNGLAAGGVPAAPDCSGGCAAQYDSTQLSTANSGSPLKYSSSTGFFSYSDADAVDTGYKRLIKVIYHPIDPVRDYLEIIVTVSWPDHGNNSSLTVRENIYNWWQN